MCFTFFFPLQDVVTGRSPLLFRKLSNPDIFSSTGKAKLQRQLSQDDCKLRRGSLASSLSGKDLIFFFLKSFGTVLSMFKGVLTWHLDSSSVVTVFCRTLVSKAVFLCCFLIASLNPNLINLLDISCLTIITGYSLSI